MAIQVPRVYENPTKVTPKSYQDKMSIYVTLAYDSAYHTLETRRKIVNVS